LRIPAPDEYSPSVRFALALAVVALVTLPRTVCHAALAEIISDPASGGGDGFGAAVAAVGADIAVGVPGQRDGAGVVRLFDGAGVPRRTFAAPNAVAGAALGMTLAVGDGLLYASAPADRSLGVGGVGAVYVFDAADGGVVRIIRAPDPDAGSAPVGDGALRPGVPNSTTARPVALGFGQALAVDGGRLAAGAPESVVDGVAAAGAAYLFDARGALRRTLRESSPRAGARFGASVALVGDVLLVGASGAPAGGLDGAGVVWLFDATTGTALATLTAPQPAAGAAFGAVVGSVGDALFVGAPGESAGAGAVYLIDAVTAGVRRVITAPSPSPSLAFGSAIVAADANLLIGADGANDGAGAAFLVDPRTGLVPRTFASTRGGRFGFALAVVGRSFAIGEPAFDATASGRVYVFDEATSQGSNAAGVTTPVRQDRPPVTSPAVRSCPETATPPSVACRLAALRAAVTQAGLYPLARPLARARQAVRAGDAGHGRRRVRAFRRAARQLGSFAVRLASASPALHDDLLASTRAVQADVARLAAAP
jgi:hypothetical protein